MNAQQPVYLTPEGVARLRQELEEKIARRPEMTERLRRAIQQGDLAENADYITAKEEQGFLEGRIQQIEALLRRAVIIESDGPADEVRLGSRVTVVEDGGDGPEVFHLVGPAEADPGAGRVSYESPLGQALLGRRVGEAVSVRAPAGEIVFRITAIE